MIQNQHEQPGWWEDLPPKIRERFGSAESDEHIALPPTVEPPFPAPFGWLRDYSVLAVLFLAAAIVNVVLLLIVLAYIDGVAMPFQGR